MAAIRTLGWIAAGVLGLALAQAEPALAETRIDNRVGAQVRALMPPDGIGGVAVAVRSEGRTLFFNHGWADAARSRPVTSDTLFNLASVGKLFDATLLALAAHDGEVRLEDPVAAHVAELSEGGDVRRITLGQLASYTSGFTLPQDHPPWPPHDYTWPDFVRLLNAWTADADHEPGRQLIYSHAGFMLLHVALERRFGIPYPRLLQERLIARLGLASTMLPMPGNTFRGELPAETAGRAVQGFSAAGEPAGAPGEQQGFYHWPGTGQMYSSARDMALFLAANLGETDDPRLREAMELAHRPVFFRRPDAALALAWERYDYGADPVRTLESYGGLYNTSAYIALIPAHRLGIVMLTNRGGLEIRRIGRRLLLALAGHDPALARE